VRVELGELQSNGTVRIIPQTWSNTDRNGSFTISNVPLGRIVLGANLNGAPSAALPFDAAYVPGTQQLSAARVFTVPPGQHLTAISLQLPKPLALGDLYVGAIHPSGLLRRHVRKRAGDELWRFGREARRNTETGEPDLPSIGIYEDVG
jgi:hypothetical protein